MIANLQKGKNSQIMKKGQKNDSVGKNLLLVLRIRVCFLGPTWYKEIKTQKVVF